MCASPQGSDCPEQPETGVVGEEKETRGFRGFEDKWLQGIMNEPGKQCQFLSLRETDEPWDSTGHRVISLHR